MMLLFGSRALNYYIPLNRPLHDWDIIVDQDSYNIISKKYKDNLVKSTDYSDLYRIGDEFVEVRGPKHHDESDKQLLHKYLYYEANSLQQPMGIAKILSIDELWAIKAATYEYIKEPKHKYDLDIIEGSDYYNPLDKKSELFYIRSKEIQERVLKSKQIKQEFFHKYHIPEYIYHDEIHAMLADLIELKIPTYQLITNGDVSIAEEQFRLLTQAEKVNLMVEESLVLAFERWFNPQMIENGINHRLIPLFFDNDEGSPTYQILKHCCLTGLKGEAEYITSFAKNNFFEIEKAWISMKSMVKCKGIPKWYLEKLFDIRKRKLNGEQVDLGVKNEK